MKYTSAIVVMALLGASAVSARHHHGHHMHPRRDFVELRHSDEWDPSLSKFMDADGYMKDVRNSIDLDEDEQMSKK